MLASSMHPACITGNSLTNIKSVAPHAELSKIASISFENYYKQVPVADLHCNIWIQNIFKRPGAGDGDEMNMLPTGATKNERSAATC